MNRWLVLRIIVLSAALAWAIWSIQDTQVNLLADNPMNLVAPGPRPTARPGSAVEAMEVYGQALSGTERCGKGSLKVLVGTAGLEKAEWLGTGEAACLQAVVWGLNWPALPAPIELGN